MPRTTSTSLRLALVLLLAIPGLAVADPATVEITAPDGIVLKATYTSPGKPGPAVLLLHMCNSDRSAWAGLSQLLAARGIHSLALDYRGYGDSGGVQSAEARQKWAGDIDAALAVLHAQEGVDPVRTGAAGGSCGVDNAVQVARRHPGTITALALLAGSTDLPGTTFLAENPWLPVLGAASHDDGQAVELTRWTIGFSGHPGNRFLEYQQGGHGTEIFAVHDDLEPAIADWFAEHLVETPAARPEHVVARPGPSGEHWNRILAPGGVEREAERIRAARAKGEDVELPPEGALNAEGYRLIATGETQRAIALLQLVVDAFPKSANALDSLADAYLADGQPDKAAELARRALDAIPGDPGLDATFAQAIRESAEGKLTPKAP